MSNSTKPRSNESTNVESKKNTKSLSGQIKVTNDKINKINSEDRSKKN